SRGELISKRICVGPCLATPLVAQPEFELLARVTLWLSLQSVTRSGIPTLGLGGALQFEEGVSAVGALAGACHPFGNPEGATEGARVPVVMPGATLEIPPHIVAAREPEKLWVSLVLRSAWGGLPGAELTAGRCVRPS